MNNTTRRRFRFGLPVHSLRRIGSTAVIAALLAPTALVHPLLALPLLALPLRAQASAPHTNEVDGLIRSLRQAAVREGSDKGALGDGSCRHTAMVLSAMAGSHRRYGLFDGPAVRVPLAFLFRCRQSDGSFASAKDTDPVTTTAWVWSALRTLDREHFAQDIAKAEAWLASKDRSGPGLIDWKPATIETAVRSANQVLAGKPSDAEASIQALLTLVAAQKMARGDGNQSGDQTKDRAQQKATFTAVQQKGYAALLKHQEGGVFFLTLPVKSGDSQKMMRVRDASLTALGLAALQSKPLSLRSDQEKATIASGLLWLAQQQHKDGALKGAFGDKQLNYTTCAAVMALSKSKDPRYTDALKLAQRYILAIQNVEKQDYAPSDRDYGSFGYGGSMRGDLSNSQFALDALRKIDAPDAAKTEAFAKAIAFLQRTQNLRSTNDLKEVKTILNEGDKEPTTVTPDDDGGACYYPGNSAVGYKTLPDGRVMPRSYGSMTYALLKAYTLCGLPKDDQRIQAAVRWIGRNWDLDQNPGADEKADEKVRYQGLFYYYMVLAQALDTAQIDRLPVAATRIEKVDGKEIRKVVDGATMVDWRAELRAKLGAMQNADGSWRNVKNGRWWESMDLICTTYSLLALEHCN